MLQQYFCSSLNSLNTIFSINCAQFRHRDSSCPWQSASPCAPWLAGGSKPGPEPRAAVLQSGEPGGVWPCPSTPGDWQEPGECQDTEWLHPWVWTMDRLWWGNSLSCPCYKAGRGSRWHGAGHSSCLHTYFASVLTHCGPQPRNNTEIHGRELIDISWLIQNTQCLCREKRSLHPGLFKHYIEKNSILSEFRKLYCDCKCTASGIVGGI